VNGGTTEVESVKGPVRSRGLAAVVSVQELKWFVSTVRVSAAGSRTIAAGGTRCQ
jgi:hypothetical protein